MPNVKPIPERCHTLNVYLTLKNAKEAIAWYQKAMGAKLHGEIMMDPEGKKVMHAELQFGDSTMMVSDEFPDMGAKSAASLGGTCCTVAMYCENVDQVFDHAVKEGAKVTMPVADMFWGDRYGQFVDPFGNKWAIATHKEDLSPAEIDKRREQFFKQMAHAK